ncbi:MAG: hypothetical protein CVU60_05080 [Deltaproteobacteria bacterium HGW-Deltaproteobacteria-18]|nr:MAG: hypothetical protein CVU60_05080 [Deltaproteobacteria bacterium HGW-Deltaproteobacteria-18]
MKVVILTGRRESLEDFVRGLGVDIDWAEEATDVLNRAGAGNWGGVVVDAMTPGMDYKAFLMDLLRVNAMLNTVVITDMGEDAFHEDSEGLGVLCAVPAMPTSEHGEQVVTRLRRISGLV